MKFDFKDYIYFLFNTDDWDKPWIPELDWLNSYANMSIYNQIVLDGLAVGYKVSKYTKYMGTSHYGCFLTFHYDAELADVYYFEHFNNTNKTMLTISPYIPMRPDTFKNWSKLRIAHPLMITWMYYRPRLLKEIYQQGELGYIWRTSGVSLRVALVAALLITFTGVIGKYHLYDILIIIPLNAVDYVGVSRGYTDHHQGRGQP